MKKLLIIIFLSQITLLYSQGELKIWQEFLSLVKNNQITESRIRPFEELGNEFKPILISFLDSVRILASPSDWNAIPEILKSGNQIQFIVPWSMRGQKLELCFFIIQIDDQWYFQHIESVFIRLDKTPPPPISTFPDISETQKAWVREELYWSFIVQNVFLPISKEKGKVYALSLLKDGGGYFVASKAWVPFTSQNKAFILYLCWEQSNLRGNKVTLVSLSDTHAIVNMESQYFSLYSIAGHLKTMISLEDYKEIFETIWQDRAINAGWKLDIKYLPDNKVTFNFYRDK